MSGVPSLSPGACVGGDGIWEQVLTSQRGVTARPALFCDRDGTIVEEVGYLHRPADVALIAGAAAVLARANRLGLAVVIVTNQSGIGRGLYGWREFAAVQERMLALLAGGGARVDAVFACPHHAAARPPYAHPDHPDRKPNPGLIHRAATRLGLALQPSWLIGDRATDVVAARRAGLAGALLVATGAGSGESERRTALAQGSDGRFKVTLAGSIVAASMLLDLLGGGGGAIGGAAVEGGGA